MGWKDSLEDAKFSIRTGDGKVYYPIWKNGEKVKEFNVSSFEFINKEGTLVDRKKPKGGRYPLVFWFQGDDNIEQAEKFDKSANDSRAWEVSHPFYGLIVGQPLTLKRSDLSYNVTEVTVDFWESIDDDFPKTSTSIEDETLSRVETVNTGIVDAFVSTAAPSTADISKAKELINLSSGEFKPDKNNYNDYINITKTALKSSDRLVTNTRASFNDSQRVLSTPALFETSIKQRIDSYKKLYFEIKRTIKSVFDKKYFESQGATVISGMSLASVNPMDGDYITRSDISSIGDEISFIYKDYLTTIDENQVDVYNVKNAWSPDPYIQNQLLGLVVFSINSLYKLSFNARQERIFEVDYDTNLIILTHRFMGLDIDDVNLKKFKEINQIKNKENFLIKKGREIKYFS